MTCRRSRTRFAPTTASLLVDPREPGRRRARLDARDEARARPARQGQRHVPLRRRAAPAGVRVHAARRACGRELPDDAAERVLVALDCANEERHGAGPRRCSTRRRSSLDIDHHHDNTRFGDDQPRRRRRVVDRRDRSATSSRELDVELTPGDRRGALHRRSSPTPAASSTRTRRRRRCGSPPSSSRPAPTCTASSRASTSRSSSPSSSCWRGRSSARRSTRAAGSSSRTCCASDFAELGAAEPYSEGIIDYLRAVEGAEMAALIREPPRARRARRGA